MLQVYADNLGIKILENEPLKFTNLAVQKGNTSTKTDVSTVSLNKAGIYMISFDAVIASSDTLTTSAQLFVDGVPQMQGKTASLSTDGGDKQAMGFTTLVSVPHDNSCRCSDKGVTLQVINTGSSTDYDHVNLVVTKIC